MAAAALLSVTLVPALMMLFVRGRIVPEQRNPLNRFLIWVYRPVIRVALRFKPVTILLAAALLAASLWPAMRLGTEFMPTLNEGTLFYMPTTLPGLSVTKAAELVQTQDKIIKSFPEVVSVWGKAGRASTATDPAPTEMFETVINLKPRERMAARHDDRQADRRNGQIIAISRRVQCVDHADQGPDRHAFDRHPHASRRQGVRHRSRRDRENRPSDRGGHPQLCPARKRLRRAGDRRLLSQHRTGPRSVRPLWADGRRPAKPYRDGARRRAGHDHGRRAANATPSASAIRATTAAIRRRLRRRCWSRWRTAVRCRLVRSQR